MTDSIAHRGPDGEGFFVDDKVSLGHRRLSIIDLSEKGSQPMIYKHLVITFNGEIYNYIEIRTELQTLGHVFESNSDTEVILHAYEAWGNDCVNRFNGMWAFCIYDKKNNILFLSRDRFGVKPLNYYFDSNLFIFSSELKAIRQHKLNLTIDKIALNYYFYQKYITGKHTIFEQISKLEPAHNLIYNLQTKDFRIEKYFHLENEIEKSKSLPIDYRLSKISALLTDSVERRLIADVPVGSFLSGGIDSSLISAIIAQKKEDFKTFSIGFKDKTFDELPYSIIVSDYIKTKHHFKTLDSDSNLIENIFSRIDEPFGDPSLIPTYLLSKITREKVTVALSGDAGDEVFGGYDTYKAFKINRFIPSCMMVLIKKMFSKLPASDENVSMRFKIVKFAKDYHKNAVKRHLNWMSQTTIDERKVLLKDSFLSIDELFWRDDAFSLSSIQITDFNTYLSGDILTKVDISSMLNSLEVRSPFLDFQLVPLVIGLPDKYKIRFFKTKWLLKKIAMDYLPSKIIHRKKQGFAVPISKWISESGLIQDYISDKKYYIHNLIDYRAAMNFFDQHLKKKADYSRPLWLIFIFNFWYSNNFLK